MPELPSPIPGSSFRQLARLSTDPYGLLEEASKRSAGGPFTLQLPGHEPMVHFSSPSAMKELVGLKYERAQRAAEPIQFLIGKKSILHEHDAPHKELRRAMAPPFVGEMMRRYADDMVRLTDEELATWKPGDRIVLRDRMQNITLRVILRCVFGMEAGPERDRLEELLVEYLGGMMTPGVFLAGLLFGPDRLRRGLMGLGAGRRAAVAAGLDVDPSRIPGKRLVDLLAIIDGILDTEVERCRAEPEGREDILALLVGMEKDGAPRFTDAELNDHLHTMLVGGHETTAGTLMWALHLLMDRPDVIEALAAERAEHPEVDEDPAALRKLPLLGGVVNEALRLYPIGTAVSRRLKDDSTVDGVELPSGVLVCPCIYLAQRDPDVWEEPAEFRPERWLNRRVRPWQFLPFGAGAWRCLGAPFAELEMRIVLDRVLRSAVLERDGDDLPTPVLRGFTVGASNGVPAIVR
jgi:cytochrome P450 family 110